MSAHAKSHVRNTVEQNFRALEAACGQAGLDRSLDRLVDVCERLEKEHLAFGARLLRRKPKRQQPISTTARYFAVKVVTCDDHFKESNMSKILAYLEGCREDYQIGAMLSAALAERTGNTFKATETFTQLDYCAHFAAKE